MDVLKNIIDCDPKDLPRIDVEPETDKMDEAMKKALKKLLAVGSVLSIVMTVPGVSVLADEIQEEMVVSAAEDPEQRVETAEILDDELTDMEVSKIIKHILEFSSK